MYYATTVETSSSYWGTTTTASNVYLRNTATTCSTSTRQARWWFRDITPILWSEAEIEYWPTHPVEGVLYRTVETHPHYTVPEPLILTEQEQAAQVVYAAARQQEREDARERARALLLSHLTPEQRAAFEVNKWFVVEGGKSKRQYRINAKGSLVANIDLLQGDKVEHRLCAHCSHMHGLPLDDQLLLQKLMLETDEDKFLIIANQHRAA